MMWHVRETGVNATTLAIDADTLNGAVYHWYRLTRSREAITLDVVQGHDEELPTPMDWQLRGRTVDCAMTDVSGRPV